MTNAQLQCAHCGFDGLQLGNPIPHWVGDEYDEKNPLNKRGNWIEVPCQCEGCHKLTSVVMAFHKGEVHITTAAASSEDIFINISRAASMEQAIRQTIEYYRAGV